MADKGHYRCYVPKKFSAENTILIGALNKIIGEYEKAGYTLTVRQIYYQTVSRDILPNTAKSYSRVQALISDARLAGLISWTAIEDRGRNLRGLGYQKSPATAVRDLISSYRRDLWEDQPWRPEVWIEKEALVGVIEQICMHHRVDFFACKGYNSQSEQFRAGRRFAGYTMRGQRPIVFHLGDHDPSGLDMTRDNRERLSMFAGTPVLVQRLALNMNQIEQYNPPPNPAKITDSRAEAYIAEHGDSSWELDALSPRVISAIIGAAIQSVKDEALWDAALAREADERRALEEMAEDLGG